MTILVEILAIRKSQALIQIIVEIILIWQMLMRLHGTVSTVIGYLKH